MCERTDSLNGGKLRQRALAWIAAVQSSVPGVATDWTHGTVLRAEDYPTFWDFNVVRVEEDPQLSVAELIAFAEEALAGLEHRRVDFLGPDATWARAEFEAAGWLPLRLLWMHHAGSTPALGDVSAVEELPYDAVRDLRIAWHAEDFPEQDRERYEQHLLSAREVAGMHGARVLAAHRQEHPVGFAQLESVAGAVEISQVFVLPEHRGAGLGTALASAAIAAAPDAEDLWICADDDARAKHLYERLGFRPVCVTTQFLRLPAGTPIG